MFARVLFCEAWHSIIACDKVPPICYESYCDDDKDAIYLVAFLVERRRRGNARNRKRWPLLAETDSSRDHDDRSTTPVTQATAVLVRRKMAVVLVLALFAVVIVAITIPGLQDAVLMTTSSSKLRKQSHEQQEPTTTAALTSLPHISFFSPTYGEGDLPPLRLDRRDYYGAVALRFLDARRQLLDELRADYGDDFIDRIMTVTGATVPMGMSLVRLALFSPSLAPLLSPS